MNLIVQHTLDSVFIQSYSSLFNVKAE